MAISSLNQLLLILIQKPEGGKIEKVKLLANNFNYCKLTVEFIIGSEAAKRIK